MFKLPLYGLFAAVISFVLLQFSFLKPGWGNSLGIVCLVLGLLAIGLGIAGVVRAVRGKTMGPGLLGFLDVILGALVGFYGLFVAAM